MFALAIIAWATFFCIGCKSPSEKVDDAKENLQEAHEELAQARRDSIAAEEEWRVFKVETQEKIAANNVAIAQLRAKNQGGKLSDAAYAEKVADLEEKNKDLQRRIDDYDKYRSDWETFKREFSRDMEELGKSLKDITVDNEK